jgi:hypothetical protein
MATAANAPTAPALERISFSHLGDAAGGVKEYLWFNIIPVCFGTQGTFHVAYRGSEHAPSLDHKVGVKVIQRNSIKGQPACAIELEISKKICHLNVMRYFASAFRGPTGEMLLLAMPFAPDGVGLASSITHCCGQCCKYRI